MLALLLPSFPAPSFWCRDMLEAMPWPLSRVLAVLSEVSAGIPWYPLHETSENGPFGALSAIASATTSAAC
jgi:hypothetical protein